MSKVIRIPEATAIHQLAARLAVASSVLFAVLFALVILLRSDIDPTWRPLSEYALGPFGWVMTAAFLSLALACGALFVAVASQATTLPGRIGLAGIVLGALGFAIAAVFPTDAYDVAPEHMSVSGTIHSIGPVLADGIPLAAVLLGWCLARRNPHWVSVRGRLLAGAIIAVVGFLLVTVSMAIVLPAAGALGPDAPVGWQGRLMMFAYAAWIIIVAVAALRVRRNVPVKVSTPVAARAGVEV